MIMAGLKKPGRDLAQRVLGEVEFSKRLVGYRIKPNKGMMEIPMYSFQEVVGLLSSPMPYLPTDELVGWINDAMGDRELADAVKKQAEQNLPVPAKLAGIRDLLVKRLLQCRMVLK